ncbi:hypothetical protein [Streptomyces sp. SPB78]|uniref:hypothetical protein n=1 Tax=Streptomyces sp. (strain SPB78) TaxID=591157 RepID=UPI0001B56EA5|nr:hypothetical protein [Streptomyces sp. SPB78]
MNTPEFLPAFTGWERGARRRYCDRNGYHDPQWMLARVTAGPDWDRLDDTLRRIVGAARGPVDLTSRYAFTPKAFAGELAAEFARLGHADRIQLRLLPAPPAGQPTLDGRTL